MRAIKAFIRIIDIPIYRCTMEAHRGALAQARDRFAGSYPGNDQQAEGKREQLAAWWDKAHWYPWRFNEVVGYLAVMARRREIVGELFWREDKRIVGRPKGRLLYDRESLYLYVDPSWESKDIFDALNQAIGDLPKHKKRLRRRFIDTEILAGIGPDLNWKALVEFTKGQPERASAHQARVEDSEVTPNSALHPTPAGARVSAVVRLLNGEKRNVAPLRSAQPRRQRAQVRRSDVAEDRRWRERNGGVPQAHAEARRGR